MSTTSESKKPSSENKGCLSAFLLLWLGVSAALTYFSFLPVADALRARAWPEEIAEIEISEGRVDRTVSEFDAPFSYRTKYRYRYQGQAHESEESAKTSDWFDVAEWLSKYPPGGRATVHVNPANPRQNHLELPSLWILVLPVFPLAFLAGALAWLYAVWFRKRGASRPARTQSLGELGLVVMFSLFALIGGGIFFGLLWKPSIRAVTAGSWPQTTATIEFSRVGAHRGSRGGGLTHSIDVLFSYRVGGANYRSSRYDLEDAASSGVDDKQVVVDRLAPGTQVVCYYDPSHPGYAVLDRTFPSLMLLGLIPLFFFVVGVGGLLRRAARVLRGPPQPQPAGGPKQLVATQGKLAVFAFFLGVCIIWNGITAVPVAHVFQTWRRGSLDVTLAIFMVPFVLVGAAAALATVYHFLAFFTPRPQVVLSSGLRLGESANLEWRFRGAVGMLKRLRITLEGQERVRYRGQKGSTLDTHVFRRVELLDLLSPPGQGNLSVLAPADTMHSFAGENNWVQWSIRVRGEIPIWPDVNQEFVVEVLPAGGAR